MAKAKVVSAILLIMLVAQCVTQAHGRLAWTTSIVDPIGILPAVAVDSDNNPHICYDNANGLNYAVLAGSDWVTQSIDSSGSNGQLALDSNNNPHVIYAYVNGNSWGIRYASSNSSGWTTQTVASTIRPYYFAMALDSSGNPHVAYSYQESNGTVPGNLDLKYAVWNGSGWDVQTVDSGQEVYWYPSICLDISGNAHLCYFGESSLSDSNGTGLLKYATLSGNGSWNIQTVDSMQVSAPQPSIAVNSNGYPHISYANNGLKYASWNGISWDIQTIDPNKYVGDSYLKLDSSNNPHVSYFVDGYIKDKAYDQIRALNYAVQVGSKWSVQTVDTSVTRAAPLALDAHGIPSVIYQKHSESGGIGGVGRDYDLTYAVASTAASPKYNLSAVVLLASVGTIIVVSSLVLFFIFKLKLKRHA